MIYSLINPSDVISFHANSDAVARFVGLLLGNGQFGVEDVSGKTVLPIFLLATREDVKSYLEDKELWNGHNYEDFLKISFLEAADALETFAVMPASDREKLDKRLELFETKKDREAYLLIHNDKHRTSLSDICGEALSMARSCRSAAAKTASSVATQSETSP